MDQLRRVCPSCGWAHASESALCDACRTRTPRALAVDARRHPVERTLVDVGMAAIVLSTAIVAVTRVAAG